MTEIIRHVPAYYFPTTVLLVDDDQQYLAGLETILDKGAAVYKSFNSPTEIQEYIKTHFKPQHLPSLCIKQKPDTARFHREINVSVEPIQREVFNPNRFEHIAAIVADHDMPDMKGLEFFKRIKDLPIRKILLTGAATLQEAIDAFNAHIIDQYISKDIKNFPEKVNETIQKQCVEQFKSDTKIVVKNLIVHHSDHEPSCLNSDAFMTLLDDIIQKNHIVEYYLIDENGLAEDSDEPVAPEIIQQLKDHKLIAAIFTDEDRQTPPKDWMAKGLLHASKKFTSHDQDYYYAYIDKDSRTNVIDTNKIVSFYQYQTNLPG